MNGNQAALDAALAQIDRAFGKAPADAPPRVSMKVWMDPFTEDHVLDFIRARVNDWLPDDFDMRDNMWEEITDAMADGEHRILDHDPLGRMYPPVTLGERFGLFLRRLFGRFQRSDVQKWDAEMARYAPPRPQPAPAATYSPDNPPF